MKITFGVLLLFLITNLYAGGWDDFEPVTIKTNQKEDIYYISYKRRYIGEDVSEYTYHSAELWSSRNFNDDGSDDSKLISNIIIENFLETPEYPTQDFSAHANSTKGLAKKYQEEIKKYEEKSHKIIKNWLSIFNFSITNIPKVSLKAIPSRTKTDHNNKRHSYWWGFELPKDIYPKTTELILHLTVKRMQIQIGDIYIKLKGKKAKKDSYFEINSFDGLVLKEPRKLELYYLKKSKRLLGVFSGWKGHFWIEAPPIQKN